jgi:hypothetical protein
LKIIFGIATRRSAKAKEIAECKLRMKEAKDFESWYESALELDKLKGMCYFVKLK